MRWAALSRIRPLGTPEPTEDMTLEVYFSMIIALPGHRSQGKTAKAVESTLMAVRIGQDWVLALRQSFVLPGKPV